MYMCRAEQIDVNQSRKFYPRTKNMYMEMLSVFHMYSSSEYIVVLACYMYVPLKKKQSGKQKT